MPSLQCVRAGAALLVVYFHSVLQIELFGIGIDGRTALTETPFPLFGKCGVDVFFVLSGLLMWRSTTRDRVGIRQFYVKRILRIVPLYWTVTTVAVLVALAMPGLLKSTRLDPAHIVASLLFVPWRNPVASGGTDLMTPLVVPGWTLNFEMFFYLVFGLTLAVPVQRRFAYNLIIFSIAIALVSAFQNRSPVIAFYEPTLIAEFVAGIGLGVVLDRKLHLPPWPAAVLLAVAIVTLCWCDAAPPGIGRLIGAALPALAIVFAVTSLDLAGRWPALPWLVRLGDATFSLYLTHVFVVAGLRSLFVRLHAPLDHLAAQAGYLASSLVASCVTGLLVYRFVERPLGEALRLRRGQPSGTQSLEAWAPSGPPVPAPAATSGDFSRSSSVSGF